MSKQKLELTWIGKDQQPQLEPRILIEDREKSFGDRNSQNMLIHGDNLLALKALEHDYTNKIKCIYIDPPYNTGSAFEHYDDGIEHSLWLSLLKPRIELLRCLLSSEGSLWISIDDNECHYLKVLCDEIFGRLNFVASIIWQKRTSPDIRATLGAGHDYILVYAKKIDEFKNSINKLEKSEFQKAQFKNPDNDPFGPWVSSDFTAQGYRPNQMYKILTPGGKEYSPPEGRCWKNVEEVYLRLHKEGRMWYGKDGKGVPRRKTYLKEQNGITAWTWWPHNEVGNTQESKKEILSIFGLSNVFDTPKPERLIKRIIELSSNKNDWVLDSFLGSGTTSAVAHKMGRNWIGIELGDHCDTHCFPRLKKVVTGEDLGGISELVNWKGGGGFKYYYLAPSLLQKDKYDNWVIEKSYNPEMLAAAMSKHEGFRFNPDEHAFWKQGQSTEKDFIFTTTTFITVEYLDKIHEEMNPEETLLICCRAFQEPCQTRYNNINIRKIPSMLLGRCEFGKDDYSLNIVNVPLEIEQEPTPDSNTLSEIKSDKKRSSPGKKDKNQDTSEPTLF